MRIHQPQFGGSRWLRCLALVALILLCSVKAAVSSDELPATDAGQGTTEVMLRSRADEQEFRELQQAQAGEQTFRSLQNLFSRSADVPIPTANGWRGLRSEALAHLKQTTPDFQRAWDRYAKTAAADALKNAITTSDPTALQELSLRFPLTDIHLQSQFILISLDCFRGQPAGARLRLDLLSRQFSGAELQSSLNQRTAAINSLIQKSRQNSRPAAETASDLMVAVPDTDSPQPWPQPAWTWTERVCDLPGLPAPDLSRLLLSAAPDPPIRLPQYHRWPATRWKDWILTRTPVRIAALDAKTGREAWSLPALLPPTGLHESTASFGEPESPLAGEMLRPTWGRLITSGDLCLAIDGFAVESTQPSGNRLNFLPDPDRPNRHRHGSRLIALHASTDGRPPTICWTAGTDSGEAVSVTTTFPAESQPAASPAESDTAGTSLDNHLFVSLPAVLDQRVFIVSHSPDYIVLNCLDRRNGQVLWQQPIGYLPTPGYPERYRGTTDCIVHGNQILCTLQTGLLISLSQLDGSIDWVRQLATDTSNQAADELLSIEVDAALRSIDGHPPTISTSVSQNQILCAEPGIGSISCLDCQSGSLIWSVPDGIAADASERAQDLQVLAHTSQQIILTGRRHCRCLEASTGKELWSVTPGSLNGVGVVHGPHCLLPLAGGRIALIDTSTGQILPGSQITLPIRTRPVAGACLIVEQTLLTATAGAVTAWPTAESIARQSGQAAISADPLSSQLRSAMAESLLSRKENLAIRSANLRTAGNNEAAQRVDQLRIELLLETLASEVEHSSVSQQIQMVLFDELLSLQPSSRQHARTRLLSGLLSNKVQLVKNDLQDRSFDRQLIPINQTWLVSPISLPDFQATRLSIPTDGRAQLSTDDIETALLHPAAAASHLQRLEILRWLQTNGRTAAGDLWISAWASERSDRSEDRDVILAALREMRPPSLAVTAQREAPALSTTSPSACSITCDLRHSAILFSNDVDRPGIPVENLPPWMNFRLFAGFQGANNTAGESSDSIVFAAQDPSGSEVSELRIPGSGRMSRLRFSDRPHETTPGLMTLAARERLTALHLSADGRISELWSAPTERSAVSDELIVPGPVLTNRVFWLQGDSLHCSHALTGRDLWQRRELDISEDLPFFFSPGESLPLTGDTDAVVLFDPIAGTRSAWDTTTGKLLGHGPLRIGLGTRPAAFGRFLVATSETGRLQIHNGVTGDEILATAPEVTVNPQLIHRFCSRLDENRLLSSAGEQGLIAIDLQTSRILFHVDDARLRFPASDMLAFESEGGLFVLLRQWDRMSEHRGSQTVPFVGRLLRLDSTTGTIVWTRDLQTCELHWPQGSPSGVLIELSGGTDWEQQRGQPLRVIPVRLSVVRLSDGATLGSAENIPLTFPVSVAHERSESLIRVETAGGGVSIRLQP